MGSIIAAASLLIGNSFERVHLQDVKNLQEIIDDEYKRLGKRASDEVTNIVKSNGAEIIRSLSPDQNVRDVWRQIGSGTGLGILELGDGNGTIVASVHDPARFAVDDKEALRIAKTRKKTPALRMYKGNRLAIVYIAPIPDRGHILAFVVGGYYLKEQLRPINAGADFVFLLEGKVLTLLSGTSISVENLKENLIKIANSTRESKSPKSADPKKNKIISRFWKFQWLKKLVSHPKIELPRIKIGNRDYTIGVVPLLSYKNAQLGAIIAAFSDIQPRNIQTGLIRSLIGVSIVGIAAAYIAGYFIARSVTKPLQDLVDGVGVISKGDLDYKIETDAQGEVRFLVDSVNDMTVSLKENREKLLSAERIAAWQDVARTMAHEIKNPLWPIQLSVRSLRRSYQSKTGDFARIFDQCTETIIEEVESLRKIVDEFRDFARMPKPQLQECDLNTVIGNTLTLYTGLPEGIEIVTELSDDMPHIMGDKEQLSRIFINIISNAVQAMPDGGKLTITTLLNSHTSLFTLDRTMSYRGARPCAPTNEKPEVLFQFVQAIFADTGIGMSPEVRDKIFQPYFTTKESGTGLGMAVVHRIIKDHNGTIEVESEEGAGTRFIISFPVEVSLV